MKIYLLAVFAANLFWFFFNPIEPFNLKEW